MCKRLYRPGVRRLGGDRDHRIHSLTSTLVISYIRSPLSARHTRGDVFLTVDRKNGAGVDSRRLFAVLVVGIATVGGVAATMFLGDGGNAQESNPQFDSVPAGADGFVHIDGNMVSDGSSLDMLSKNRGLVGSSSAPGPPGRGYQRVHGFSARCPASGVFSTALVSPSSDSRLTRSFT